MEAPWPLELVQKDTQREIKLHKTPIDGSEHGDGEADAQGTGDRRTQRRPLIIFRGMCRQTRPVGGGVDIRAKETGKGRKGPLDGRSPGDYRELGAGQ